MNISELIYEYLKQGNAVDIPGVGSFAAHQVNAHYDADTTSYLPTQLRIEFQPYEIGAQGIVHYIATRDCVSDAIGERNWKNYVETVKSKLLHEGQIHITDLGTLIKTSDGISFAPNEALNKRNPLMDAVPDVHLYHDGDRTDLFAAFHQPVPQPEAALTPVIAEATPNADEAQAASTDVSQDITAETASTESVPETAPTERSVTAADDNSVSTPLASANNNEPASFAVDTETEAVETETVAETTPDDANTTTPKPDQPNSSLDGLKELEDMQRGESSQDNQSADKTTPTDDTPKPKKRKTWLWILLALLVCLGGCYFYGAKINPHFLNGLLSGQHNENTAPAPDIESMTSNYDEQQADAAIDSPENQEVYGGTQTTTTQIDNAKSTTRHAVNSADGEDWREHTNAFTFSTDGLTFTADDKEQTAAAIMNDMRQYIANYARQQRYSRAVDALTDKVANYVAQRVDQLMNPDDEFLIQRFIPYDDYIRDYNMPVLKKRKANRQKNVIQTELMEDMLNNLLREVVDEQGIKADAVKAAAPRHYVSTATYSKKSKRGYDIIAGFFVVKDNADRMATNLKSKGCDAYIIEVSQGYYVSMGSAESRTKAEALYAHIKEWYKGDVSIKKF